MIQEFARKINGKYGTEPYSNDVSTFEGNKW